MAGNSRNNRARDAGIFGRLVSDNRLAAVVLAIVFGGGSGVTLRNYFPPDQELVRPDPFTGAMGREMQAELVRLITAAEWHSEERHALQDARIDDLAAEQALDRQHRAEAAGGYTRIRALEQSMSRVEERVKGNEKRLEEVLQLLRAP